MSIRQDRGKGYEHCGAAFTATTERTRTAALEKNIVVEGLMKFRIAVCSNLYDFFVEHHDQLR
jgi:hypothetical protein